MFLLMQLPAGQRWNSPFIGGTESLHQISWQSIEWMLNGYVKNFTCRLYWKKIQAVAKVIKLHPLWTINVCTKFHGNPSNSCLDISVWTKVAGWSTGVPSLELLLAWWKINVTNVSISLKFQGSAKFFFLTEWKPNVAWKVVNYSNLFCFGKGSKMDWSLNQIILVTDNLIKIFLMHVIYYLPTLTACWEKQPVGTELLS